jgi:hypothetical protein
MSKSFREFHFALLSPKSWLGVEALFSPVGKVNYSLRTKTAVKVLEIGIKDLKNYFNPGL